MDAERPFEEDQETLWNGIAGHAWVEAQALLDGMFEPFETHLAEVARAGSSRHVLDVGCGTGATTLALARATGDRGECTGIDISRPMVALARERAAAEAPAVQFLCGDAQTHVFEPGRYDLLVSRFGVMFFSDPVQAFTNLNRAAAAGAQMCLLVWRSPQDNPFMTAAERAARPLLPELAVRPPVPTGQFAFADTDRVGEILAAAGWSGIGFYPIEAECRFPAAALETYVSRLGPLGRILPALEEGRRGAVLAAVLAAFEPFRDGAEIRFEAACWDIRASKEPDHG